MFIKIVNGVSDQLSLFIDFNFPEVRSVIIEKRYLGFLQQTLGHRMKISRVIVIAAGLISTLLLVFVIQKLTSPSVRSYDALDSTFHEPVIGTFELNAQQTAHSFSHYALKLDKHPDNASINKLIAKIPDAAHLIITISMPGTDYASAPNVLKEVREGAYDAKIKAFCLALARKSGTTYLRWNPEMEVPVQLYPWQYQAPVDYIEAFNHFCKLARSVFPAVKIVWGPAGYPGSDEYWPGPVFVDYISVTIDGKSELAATAFPAVKDPEENVRRKIQRMRMFGKPVLVMKAGSVSEADLKAALVKAAASTRLNAGILYQTQDTEGAPNVTEKRTPLIGVYDPKALLVNSGLIDAEHIFVDLIAVQNGQFERDFNAIVSRRHDAIVSIEPWHNAGVKKDSNALGNVINGIYDAEFAEIYRVLATSKQTVYLRFAHEMEIPIHRYAWQSQDPVLYIKAFRYFMNFDGSKNKRIKKVWGPAGDRGSIEWWPGDDVVDYISIAIYGLPDKNITDPEQQESFETIYNRKHYRMRLVNKPIFITEFGVKGPENFKKKWLEKAAEVIGNRPEIRGVSYFNLADNPKVWGNIPPPDWSVSKPTFQHFVNTLSMARVGFR
ncbi:glycoside hydrolase family 26 protein [Dyadobacter sandarakinus]|uniref:GH26 domain-containing protein n=1 Tax=Dyadobacter sandarakinus TaxID=2747268 RepID=A0ABX7I572_9BACT|nr:hypothetical protein [Dyadobacter sandarakinus]QRR00171.1 hypothetical protein HWI92_04260 [Dyadobacter sandarakinus]